MLPGAPWAEVQSDLPADPALRLVTLPNGVRLAILPNAEPAGRASLRLLVSVGSLHERDDERGLAHFVEHMAFRGTHNHPHGGLIAVLERMGMGFGPDSAAFTGHDHTIYHLDLPDAKSSTIAQGIGIFRDYAAGIDFAPADIKRERGVILSEKATRDTPAERAGRAYLGFIWPDAPQNVRSPIGVESQIRKFNRRQFLAFYDAWYRPERIALIAVGDFDPEEVERLAAAGLGGLVARAPAREEPAPPGPLARPAPPFGLFLDPGMVGVQVSLAHARLDPPRASGRADRARQLHEALACHMVQRRLAREARKPGARTGEPAVAIGSPLPGLRVAGLSLPGNLDHWDDAVRLAGQSLRAVLAHGFTRAELDEVRAFVSNALDQAVLAAGTRRSEELCGQLAGRLLLGTPFVRPADIREDIAPALAAATPEDCLAAFRDAWGDGEPRVFISANSGFSSVSNEQIQTALREARAGRADAPGGPPGAGRVEFAYRYFGAPGAVTKRTAHDDLAVTFVDFSNGVRLNFKPTDFERNAVWISIRAGDGKLSQPHSKPGLDLFAGAGFVAGGLGRHSADEVVTLLNRHMVSFQFVADTDHAGIRLRCPTGSLPFALRLAAAYLTDAAWRPEAHRQAVGGLVDSYQHAFASPVTRLRSIIERVVAQDPRFGWPTLDEPYARTMAEARDWLQPQFMFSAAEVTIVGDATLDEAIAAVAPTLAALPARPPPARNESFLRVAARPARKEIPVPVSAMLRHGALAVLWPVDAIDDVHHERACLLLAEVLSSRVRGCLREELGVTYNADAAFVRHDGFPAFNYFVVLAEVDKADIGRARSALRKTFSALVAKGLGEDEFLRARQPFAEHYQQSWRTNAYWAHTLLRDTREQPWRLDHARTRQADIESLTRDEINTLARRHLDAGRAWHFRTVPAGK